MREALILATYSGVYFKRGEAYVIDGETPGCYVLVDPHGVYREVNKGYARELPKLEKVQTHMGEEWVEPAPQKPYLLGPRTGEITPLLETIRKAACPHLPEDAKARKAIPLATGLLDYFPDALCAVAALSFKATEQHHPGEPCHWDRNKSADEADTLLRHFVDRGTLDTDGVRHSAKVAWRALALLQKEIEAAREQE